MNANFKEKIFQLVDLKNPPELTLRSRKSVLGISDLKNAVVGDARVQNETVLGLILLWHDYWTESHAIAQTHEGDRDFDLLHAIGHRREGDYGNSSYWFKVAGKHPMFGNLSTKIEAVFNKDVDLLKNVLPGRKWNPAAFVGLVKADPQSSVLRSIQAIEMHCFLDFLISGAE